MSDATTLSKQPPAGLSFRISERYYAPILVSLILIVGQVSFHFLTSPTGTAIGILSSILTELIMGFLFYRKLPNFASAYVSGISVGILVQSTMVWPYVLCCIIAILSKYCIRIDKRHLWNPSNLGIVTLLLVAPRYVSTLGAQAGNSMFAMAVIWIVGSIIVYRIKRLHICLTYVFFFLCYAVFRSVVLGHYVTNESFLQEAAPITGPMYQLFIFFMITDPKTTVHSRKGQMLVAFLVATVENIFRMYGTLASPPDGTLGNIVSTHAPYFALTLMGPSANLIEILKLKSKLLSANNTALTARNSELSEIPASSR